MADTVNAARAMSLMDRQGSRIVHHILLSDSNSVFGGYGWDHGIRQALLDFFGADSMQGTGIHAFGENDGEGNNSGYGNASTVGEDAFTQFQASTGIGATTLAGHKTFWDHSLDTGGTKNVLTSDYYAGTISQRHGLKLGEDNPLGIASTVVGVRSDALTWRIWAGVFKATDAVAGAVWNRPRTRYDGAVKTDFGSQDFLGTSHDGGADTTRVPTAPFEFTQASHSDVTKFGPLVFAQVPGSSAGDLHGIFQEIIREDMTNGWAVSTLYSVGGAEAGEANVYLGDMTDSRLSNYIDVIKNKSAALGQTATFVFWHCFGINDAGGGVSKADFKTAMEGQVTKLQAALSTSGVDVADSVHILFPTHPQEADDSTIDQYRDATRELAASNGHIAHFGLQSVTSFSELNVAATRPAYGPSGFPDKPHLDSNADLTDNSYPILASRMLAAIEAAAAGSGPRSPTSGTASGAAIAWVNPGNILASDDAKASSTINFDETTQELFASDYGFSIPDGDTINGIEVGVELSAGAANVIIDAVAQMTKVVPVPIGNNLKKNQIEFWPTADTIIVYGGAIQLWGLGWTPAEINASGFGFAFAAFQEQAGATACFVDHITITVYHSSLSGLRNRQTRGIRRRIQSIA